MCFRRGVESGYCLGADLYPMLIYNACSNYNHAKQQFKQVTETGGEAAAVIIVSLARPFTRSLRSHLPLKKRKSETSADNSNSSDSDVC